MTVGSRAGVAVTGLVAVLAGCRGDISSKPPIHLVLDMDFQQKLKAQSESTFEGWADHRGMRSPVQGTIARGGQPAGASPAEYYIPKTHEMFASFDADRDGRLSRLECRNLPLQRHRLFDLADRNGDGGLDREELDAIRKVYTYKTADNAYVAENPLPATRAVLERGRERFDINCAVCHGRAAMGGMVARRWPIQIPNLVTNADADNRARLVGLTPGEIFETVSNGKGTMPSYAQQISVEDRWAIIHYVKALQKYFN